MDSLGALMRGEMKPWNALDASARRVYGVTRHASGGILERAQRSMRDDAGETRLATRDACASWEG